MLCQRLQLLQGAMHAADLLPTIVAALGSRLWPNETQPLDGIDVWPALLSGGPSPRTSIYYGISQDHKGPAVRSCAMNVRAHWSSSDALLANALFNSTWHPTIMSGTRRERLQADTRRWRWRPRCLVGPAAAKLDLVVAHECTGRREAVDASSQRTRCARSRPHTGPPVPSADRRRRAIAARHHGAR